MSKSIKFKNNNYLDSSSIVHNKEVLSEVLNKKVYSNDEQKIGIWTDGKPVYRTTFYQRLNQNTTVKNISDLKVKEIVGYQALMKGDNGTMFPAVYFASNEDNARWFTNSNMTEITFHSTYSGDRGVIFTFEYTKTTD